MSLNPVSSHEILSVADVNSLPEVTEIHRILFLGNVVIVEGLVNLDQITASTTEVANATAQAFSMVWGG